MQPSIPPRSAVVVEPGRFHVGQVITFVHRGEVITHRLIAKDATGRLMTRGDANERPNPWQLRRTDVMGGVVAAPRSLGFWLVYFRTVAGAGSVVFGALSISLAWGLASRVEDADDGSRRSSRPARTPGGLTPATTPGDPSGTVRAGPAPG